MSEDETQWITKIKTQQSYKDEIISNLNKLGFPLEYKVRNFFDENGFRNISEGYYDKIISDSTTINKSFDIIGYKDNRKSINNKVTIDLQMMLIGECKTSNYIVNLLLSIPESGNLENKGFLSPIMTKFISLINVGYSTLVSNYIAKYGNVSISNDIKDTSINYILSKDNKNEKTPEYEKIYNITEETLLPAIFYHYLYWISNTFKNYDSDFSTINENNIDNYFNTIIKGHYYIGLLFIPFIVTTKPILKPIFEKNQIKDIEEIEFTIYEHLIKDPNYYYPLMMNVNKIGLFIVNEKYLDSFLSHITNLHDNIVNEICDKVNNNPKVLYYDYQEMIKRDDNIIKNGYESILNRNPFNTVL